MSKLKNRILSERRLVIVLQLGLLAFILVGIFGAILVGPKQAAQVGETVNIDSVPTKKSTTASVPEKMSSVQVRAAAAYVWDVKAQRALYTKNATEALPLASITKLMTSLLALELVSGDTNATISARAVSQEGSTGLTAGEQLSVLELNKLALISSSNDAAYALGATAGRMLGDNDPSAQFVQGMNIRAEELKLETLHFKNTTGLDLSPSESGATGSARDVSFLMEYILTEHPEIIEPTKRGAARVYNEQGDYHDLENTNEALYAIPNLLGSKTGYTDLAGGNLTIAFDAGLNRPIIVTVLGSTREERFSDVTRLVEAVREHINEF